MFTPSTYLAGVFLHAAGYKVLDKMSQFDNAMLNVVELVENNAAVDNLVTTASKATGTRKEYIALGGLALPFLFLLLMGGANFLIDLIAYLYPAYASVRAIESDKTEDDTQWLTYWLVFSLFKLIEGVADSLLQYIPFYSILKIVFLVWCFYPGTDGAMVVYSYFIKPNVVPLLGALVKKNNKKAD